MARKNSNQGRRVYKISNQLVVLHGGRRYACPRRISDIDVHNQVTVEVVPPSETGGWGLAQVMQGSVTELWTTL